MPGIPIDWETEGIGDCDGRDCRKGSVVVTIAGEPTHMTLKKNLVPGHWSIIMRGANAGFTEVAF